MIGLRIADAKEKLGEGKETVYEELGLRMRVGS